jgi:hypothetical protein
MRTIKRIGLDLFVKLPRVAILLQVIDRSASHSPSFRFRPCRP